MNILAVDGNLVFSGLLKKVLADIGESNLITCSSGQLALSVSDKFTADILIMDINLSDMDGLEMLKKLNNPSRDIYVLVIADKQDYERLEEALALGIDDYILKPLEGKELIVRVKKAIYARETRASRPVGEQYRYQPLGPFPEELRAATEPEDDPAPLSESYFPEASGAAVEAASADLYSSSYFVTPAADEALPFQSRLTSRSQRGRYKKAASKVKPQPSVREANENALTAAARLLGNVIFACLLVIVASLAFFLVQSRLAGGIPSVFGYQLYVVLSGSMNPAFDTGSLALVRPVDPADIAVGDIITFKGFGGGTVLTTHRVVAVNREDELSFTTRGDANNINDPNPVPAGNVVGQVHGSIPYLGYVMGFAQTRNGLLILVVVPGILVIFFEIRNLYKYITDNGKSKEQQRADHLSAG
ncbi:MAG: signal peptidase I [Bacillota bacterium]